MSTLSYNCLNAWLTAAKIVATIRKNCRDTKLIWLCIKPGIQERGTECGERGEWGECYIPGNVAKNSGECPQTFRRMSPNISGNVLKYSGECRQIFHGMSSNIPGNVAKHSGKCRQTFRGMSLNISGYVLKQSREYSKISWGML